MFNMGKKFNLAWHTFSSHGKELFQDLLESQEFTDVTLVSDDQHQYKVHKFILSASSTVFNKILTSDPLNTSIYLRGIQHEELESILQFIYLGEATINHERMNEFLNAAMNLDIKEIGKNAVYEENKTEDMNEKQTLDDDNLLQSDEDPIDDETVKGKTTSQVLTTNSSSSRINNHKKAYKCQQCDYQATDISNFNRHVKTIHEGIKYPCQHCDYQATRLDHLQIHIKTKHEGIRYPCEQCDYKATTPINLKIHTEFKHEGIKYPCQQCDYRATLAKNLRRHIMSKH